MGFLFKFLNSLEALKFDNQPIPKEETNAVNFVEAKWYILNYRESEFIQIHLMFHRN
jgi:hypothetical protein